MDWYIVYKGKAHKDSLGENLRKAGVKFYMPIENVEYLEDNQIKVREEQVLRNLIFIQTDKDIVQVANAIDGLRAPYYDRTTNQPAVVNADEMLRFMRFLQMKNMNATVLQDPYSRFKICQKVRVRAGEFAGTEGYIFRIRGDRKLVISLGDMAIAISGIHHTLLESIE